MSFVEEPACSNQTAALSPGCSSSTIAIACLNCYCTILKELSMQGTHSMLALMPLHHQADVDLAGALAHHLNNDALTPQYLERLQKATV
jgi:hypothetical protein